MTKQIIDDTIMSLAEAKEIAEAQLVIWKVKQPSIVATCHAALYSIEAGQTVNLTMVRPTIAAANYVVRRIDVKHFGYNSAGTEIMKTTLYLGLGSTPIEEKRDNEIRELILEVHKAKLDR